MHNYHKYQKIHLSFFVYMYYNLVVVFYSNFNIIFKEDFFHVH